MTGRGGPYTLIRVSVAAPTPQGDTEAIQRARILLVHVIDNFDPAS